MAITDLNSPRDLDLRTGADTRAQILREVWPGMFRGRCPGLLEGQQMAEINRL